MIFLDRAQTLAPDGTNANSIGILEAERSGRTKLAIAVQAAEVGATCLLVGASSELGKPLEHHAVSSAHAILRKLVEVLERPNTGSKPLDHLDGRRRLDAAATRLAACILRHAGLLAQNFDSERGEVELSVLVPQPIAPETLDMLVIAVHDAGQIARLLWAGDRLSGRTLSEVEGALAGRRCDVSADELLLSLILADDGSFEKKLTAILKTAQLLQEEERLVGVISALRNPPPTDETVKEVHERTRQMAQMLRGAIALVKQRGSLQKALQAQPRTRAAAVVEFFLRDHPSAEAEAALRLFAKLADQCEQDRAALASCLDHSGTRHVSSVAKLKADTPRHPSDRATIGSYVQGIREARYASRQLPGLMERLRETLSPPTLDGIARLPLNKIVERIEATRLIMSGTSRQARRMPMLLS